MIIYENSLHEFVSDVTYNRISDILMEKLRDSHLSGGSPGEKSAWQNSLHFMKDVLSCREIPGDCEVAIEYNIPQTSKRVDFMILGADHEKQDHIVIVELKQWSRVQKVDDWSRHSVMTDLRSHQPTAHPSYQAFSYKSLILNYCELKGMSEKSLNPCAYLHNMDEGYRPVLEDKMYADWTREAPVFLSHDVLKLRSFIQRYISTRSENGDSFLLVQLVAFGCCHNTDRVSVPVMKVFPLMDAVDSADEARMRINAHEIRGSLQLPLFSFRDHQAFLALTGLAITRVRGKMPIAHNDRKNGGS